jgi:hypothetical protein
VVLTFWNHKKESIIKVLEEFGEMDSNSLKLNDVMFFQKYFEIFKNGHL